MKERPILFSAPMVLAILAGRKTQTRRLIKPQPPAGYEFAEFVREPHLSARFENKRPPLGMWTTRCPQGQPGDRLWVREAFVYRHKHDRYYYRADHPVHDPYAHNGWRPSIHMPRVASRILLEVTEVRVQRLQDITEEDARAEGVEGLLMDVATRRCSTAREEFVRLWDSINADRAPWASNPYVWAISFKRVPNV